MTTDHDRRPVKLQPRRVEKVVQSPVHAPLGVIMNCRKWVIALVLLLSVMSFTGTASAEGQASIYIGRTFTSALFLENMTTFGGTVGAYGGVVGFEFGLEYSPKSNFQVPFLDLGASLTNIMGNLVVQIPIGEFYPYGTIGYGVVIASASTDVPNEFLGTNGAFNFGFGAKVFFSRSVGLRLDYRRFAIQTGDEDPDLGIPFTGIRIEASPDLNRFVGGVTFRF